MQHCCELMRMLLEDTRINIFCNEMFKRCYAIRKGKMPSNACFIPPGAAKIFNHRCALCTFEY